MTSKQVGIFVRWEEKTSKQVCIFVCCEEKTYKQVCFFVWCDEMTSKQVCIFVCCEEKTSKQVCIFILFLKLKNWLWSLKVHTVLYTTNVDEPFLRIAFIVCWCGLRLSHVFISQSQGFLGDGPSFFESDSALQLWPRIYLTWINVGKCESGCVPYLSEFRSHFRLYTVLSVWKKIFTNMFT
jgi:hypothetical protein